VGGSEPNTKQETCENEKFKRLSHLRNPFPKGENELSAERGPDHPLESEPTMELALPAPVHPVHKNIPGVAEAPHAAASIANIAM
jgi:hypothetical protein